VSRATLLLSALLATLLLYLFAVELPGGKKAEPPPTVPLFSFSPDKVTGLTLRRADGGEVVLQRASDRPDAPWRLTHPIDTAADRTAVEEVLRDLSNLTPTQTVATRPDDLKPYGLDPPTGTFLVAIRGVDSEVLDVGDENPAKSGRYVSQGIGSPVTLVAPDIARFFQKEIVAWRDRRIFTGAFQAMLEQVERVGIERAEGEIMLTKSADADVVGPLLSEIGQLRVEAFSDDAGMSFVPETTLRLFAKGEAPLAEIVFGQTEGENVAAKSPGQPAPFWLRRDDVDRLLSIVPSTPDAAPIPSFSAPPPTAPQ